MNQTEGKAKIRVSAGKITRKLPVFYNPAMKLNRDISLLLLGSIDAKRMKVADPLAASGVRSIRFLLELQKSKIKKVMLNDGSKEAVSSIKNNLKLNKLKSKVSVSNDDANIFMLKNRPFDYVEIDPFGTPVPFLDAAVKGLSHAGILAVTATDTAALSGTAQKACKRKYWATPLRNHLMHELGLRILIRRIQLVAASHEKALTPIFSYSKLHYMRVFLKCNAKVSDTDRILKQHKTFFCCRDCFSITEKQECSCNNKTLDIVGPLWTGELWDKKLAGTIYQNCQDSKDFLKTLSDESKVPALGFYDTHLICKKLKLSVPNLAVVISSLKSNGYASTRTHFNSNGIRTTAPSSVVIKAVSQFSTQ